MRLRIFQSGKGDCLLLSGSGGGRVLCDGGLGTMKRSTLPTLGDIHAAGEKLDAVYVSHIDSDHIEGVQVLLEHLLDWRVHEHHRDHGDATNPPDEPRPPEIDGVWHNSFSDLISKNRRRIDEFRVQFAAMAPALYGSSVDQAISYADGMQNIATSIPQALRVSNLATAVLGIPVNAPPGRPEPGELLLVEEPNEPFDIESLRFSLIGPTKKQLIRLRDGWNNWLREPANRDSAAKIRMETLERIQRFASGELTVSPFDLGSWNGMPSFKGVTVPNTASLMFLVTDGDRTLLLTGDSQQDLILDGLRETGHLGRGHLHVDVLKVPHHGSENNADQNFCRTISADHYVFCGDGSHGNPDPGVLQLYFDSRMASDARRALSPQGQEPDRPFTFWFSTSSPLVEPGSSAFRSFEAVEAKAAELVAASGGRLETRFNSADFIDLPDADAPFL